ncbi:hypothetical protein ACLQ24_24360 [Micromonospora sp. DT4]|uniref:hypothetical protein n=1 Tax=Micromonospora sp. DT4 TaxID=3393438 RepID=UPI003CEF1DA3
MPAGRLVFEIAGGERHMMDGCPEFLVTWLPNAGVYLGAEPGSVPPEVLDAQPVPGTLLLHVDLRAVGSTLVRDVLLTQPPEVVARAVDGSARSVVAGLDAAGALARANELGLPVLVPGTTLTADAPERMLPIDAQGRPAQTPADVEYVLVLPELHLITEHPAVHGDSPGQALTGPPVPGQVRWVGADGAELGLLRPVLDSLIDRIGGLAGIHELTTSVREATPVTGGVIGLWRELATLGPGEARLVTVDSRDDVTTALALQFPGGVGLLHDTPTGVRAATLPRRPSTLSIAHADVSEKASALVTGSIVTPTPAPELADLSWLAEINPWLGVGGDFVTNCVLAAIGTDMSLQERGALRFQVPPSNPLELNDLVNYANDTERRVKIPEQGFRFLHATVADVRRALGAAAVWDRGIVAVPDTPGQPQHVVNAVRLADGVALLDGQLGRPVEIADDTEAWFLPLTEGATLVGPAVAATDLHATQAGAARPGRPLPIPPSRIEQNPYRLLAEAVDSLVAGEASKGQLDLLRMTFEDRTLDAGSVVTGSLSLPSDSPPLFGPIGEVLATNFPQGLMLLSWGDLEPAPHSITITIEVPPQYARRVSSSEGDPYVMVDLRALADRNAVLQRSGVVTLPEPVSAPATGGDLVDRLQGLLDNLAKRPKPNPVEQNSNPLDIFFHAISGMLTPEEAVTVAAWANSQKATRQKAALSTLENLPAGTLTPVWLSGKVYLAVGAADIKKVMLLAPVPPGKFSLTEQLLNVPAEVYLNGEGQLAQIVLQPAKPVAGAHTVDEVGPPVSHPAETVAGALTVDGVDALVKKGVTRLEQGDLTVFIVDAERAKPADVESVVRISHQAAGAFASIDKHLKAVLVLDRVGHPTETIYRELASDFGVLIAHPIHAHTAVVAGRQGQSLSSPSGWALTDPVGNTVELEVRAGEPEKLDPSRLQHIVDNWSTFPAAGPTSRSAPAPAPTAEKAAVRSRPLPSLPTTTTAAPGPQTTVAPAPATTATAAPGPRRTVAPAPATTALSPQPAGEIVRYLAWNQQALNDTLTAQTAGIHLPPGTVTVAGVVGLHEGSPFLWDGLNAVTPRAVANDELFKKFGNGARRILVLQLYGDPEAAREFTRAIQQRITDALSRSVRAPSRVVLGSHNPADDTILWYAATGPVFQLHRAQSVDEALRAVPPAINVISELGNRLDGHTSSPDVPTAELVNVALTPGAGQGSLPASLKREVRVPVRRGATIAEVAEAARHYLKPHTLREDISRADGRVTVPVRIGQGLSAHTMVLPAVHTRFEPSALVTRGEAGYDRAEHVWINKHQVVAGADGPIIYTAVPVAPHVKIAELLDRLRPEFVASITIEAGRTDGDKITLPPTLGTHEGEKVTAATYTSRLPDPGDGMHVVILQEPLATEDDPFVKKLASKAFVLANLVDDNGNRGWLPFRTNNIPRKFFGNNGFTTAFASLFWHDQDHRDWFLEPAAQQNAVTALCAGKIAEPNDVSALLVRRAMAAAPPNSASHLLGYLTLPRDAPTTGPIVDLLSHFPSGLAILSHERERGSIQVQVPSRFGALVGAEASGQHRTATGGSWVLDVSALAEANAQLDARGQVTLPPTETATLGISRVRMFLSVRTRVAPDETPVRRAEILFRAVAGKPTTVDASALSWWAETRGANKRSTPAATLSQLGGGAVTPVWTAAGEIALAVGTDDPIQPIILSTSNEEIDLPTLGREVDLLLDDDNRLAQIDLSVAGHAVVDLRGPARNTSEVAPADAPIDLADTVIAELSRRKVKLSPEMRRQLQGVYSHPVGRRSSTVGASRSMVDALARKVTGTRKHADPAASFRNQLLAQVLESARTNGTALTSEQVLPMLQTFIEANGLGSGAVEVTDEMVQGFMLDMAAPHMPAQRRRQLPKPPSLAGAPVWPVDVRSPVVVPWASEVEAARAEATVGVRAHVSVHPHSDQLTRSAFDVRRYLLNDTWRTELTVRVSITDPHHLTSDDGDRVFAALLSGARKLSDNPTNVLPTMGDRLTFRVERVPPGTNAHLPIELTVRPNGGTGAMNQFRWWTDAPAEAYVHELLHNLGLPDDPVRGNTMGIPTLSTDGTALHPESHLAQGALQPRQLFVLQQLVGDTNALGGYDGTETVPIRAEQIDARHSAMVEPGQPPSWPLRLDDGVQQKSHVYVISSSNAGVARTTVEQLAALADAERPVVLLGTPHSRRTADTAHDIRALNHLLEQFAQRGQLPIVVRRGAVDLSLLRVTEQYGATVLHQIPQGAGGGLAQLEPSWQATVARADGGTETSTDLWSRLDAGVLAAARMMAHPTVAVTRVDDALGSLIWAPVTNRRQLFKQLRETWSPQDVTAHRAHVEQMIQRVPDQRDLRVFAPALEFSSTGHVDVVFDYADATVEAHRPSTLLQAVGSLAAAGHLGTGLEGGLSTANLADMVTAIDGPTDATAVTVSILGMINDIKSAKNFDVAGKFIAENRDRITAEQKGQWADAIAALRTDLPQHVAQLDVLITDVFNCPPKEPAESS